MSTCEVAPTLSAFSMAELVDEAGELLPERHAMSLISINVPVVVGIAIAVNAATVNSHANALVAQFVGF